MFGIAPTSHIKVKQKLTISLGQEILRKFPDCYAEQERPREVSKALLNTPECLIFVSHKFA